MKAGALFLAMLFAALILNDLACKKSGNSIPPPVVDTTDKVLAINEAFEAYSLLFPLGGYTIFHPANPPSYPDRPPVLVRFVSPKPDSAGNCGFNIDTAVSYTDTSFAIINVNATSHFNTICNGSAVSGYQVRDTITYIYPHLPTGTFYQDQNLTVTLVNPGNISSLIVDGPIYINSSRSPDKDGGPTLTETGSFIYSNVKGNLKAINYDLVSGSVSFTDKGVNDSGPWNSSGTIVFLGSYKAKVTIKGVTYTVDIPNQQQE